MTPSIPDLRRAVRGTQLEFTLPAKHYRESCKYTVVPKYSVDDETAAAVVSVIGASDYRADRLIFSLDRTPTPEWIQTFRSINYRDSILGRDPRHFEFAGTEASGEDLDSGACIAPDDRAAGA